MIYNCELITIQIKAWCLLLIQTNIVNIQVLMVINHPNKHCCLRKSLRPGSPGRGDVRITRSPTFGMRCGLCAGVPARSTVRRVRWSVWFRRCLEYCACLVWTSYQTIVAEKGTGLGRQVHGLSYKAYSGGVGGGFRAVLRRVARRATVV